MARTGRSEVWAARIGAGAVESLRETGAPFGTLKNGRRAGAGRP